MIGLFCFVRTYVRMHWRADTITRNNEPLFKIVLWFVLGRGSIHGDEFMKCIFSRKLKLQKTNSTKKAFKEICRYSWLRWEFKKSFDVFTLFSAETDQMTFFLRFSKWSTHPGPQYSSTSSTGCLSPSKNN